MIRTPNAERCSAFPTCRFLMTGLVLLSASGAPSAADPPRGAQIFRNCMACHSIEPGQNMTGPSLAGVVGRKAGSLPSFHRYSNALQRSGIVWNEKTLDAWIRSPAELVPDNEMRFPGIPDAGVRADLIAFLKQASQGNSAGAASQGVMMGGMMGGGGLPDLKQASPDLRVTAVRYCDDTYTVTTAAGKTRKFWEFNLRFKTDSSSHGPRKNEPVLAPQGMQGDRAQLVFANPGEMATFIKPECS